MNDERQRYGIYFDMLFALDVNVSEVLNELNGFYDCVKAQHKCMSSGIHLTERFQGIMDKGNECENLYECFVHTTEICRFVSLLTITTTPSPRLQL